MHAAILIYICIAIFGKGLCRHVDEWETWKVTHGKTYQDLSDEERHKEVWEKNFRTMKEHYSRKQRTFEMELNEFADQVLPKIPVSVLKETKSRSFVEETAVTFAPDSWDWRSKGAVSPVKNQGQMGDPVTFAATECVESYGFIQSGKLITLSVAEVHDCCTKVPILSTNVFTCIHNIGGVCSESSYPTMHGKCMNKTCTAAVQINGGALVPHGDEKAMMEAVYKIPVMAGVDASNPSFQLYTSGVYSDPDCSSIRIDHVIQVVGYGTMDGQDYWICKNSWGASWGMNGYILIARNKNNMCGIASDTMYPV